MVNERTRRSASVAWMQSLLKINIGKSVSKEMVAFGYKLKNEVSTFYYNTLFYINHSLPSICFRTPVNVFHI